MRLPQNRREWQSGTTLVELLVSLVIIGFALVLIVGTFSTGLLQSTIAKRDTTSTAVLQYEMDAIGASTYTVSPQPFSDCFATETQSTPPAPASGFQGSCPSTTYTLRADVSVSAGPNGSQTWTIAVVSWPALVPTPQTISLLKVNR